MTPEQYVEQVTALGYTPHGIASILGINRRTSYRYANGKLAVTIPIARLLEMLNRFGIPKAWIPRENARDAILASNAVARTRRKTQRGIAF